MAFGWIMDWFVRQLGSIGSTRAFAARATIDYGAVIFTETLEFPLMMPAIIIDVSTLGSMVVMYGNA